MLRCNLWIYFTVIFSKTNQQNSKNSINICRIIQDKIKGSLLKFQNNSYIFCNTKNNIAETSVRSYIGLDRFLVFDGRICNWFFTYSLNARGVINEFLLWITLPRNYIWLCKVWDFCSVGDFADLRRDFFTTCAG